MEGRMDLDNVNIELLASEQSGNGSGSDIKRIPHPYKCEDFNGKDTDPFWTKKQPEQLLGSWPSADSSLRILEGPMDFDNVDIKLLPNAESGSDIRRISQPYKYEEFKGKDTGYSWKKKPSEKLLGSWPSAYTAHAALFRSRKLILAASYNHLDAVNRLLNDGLADPNIVDDQGRPAIHIAASKGYAEIVHALIRGGADPNAEDKLGNTPLHLAVYTGSIETVSHLLAGGCRPRRTKKLPYTPLELARSKYSLLFRQGNCTMAKTQVHKIIRLLMEEVVQGFYLKLNTEVERRREIESVLKSLSSLDLENTSPPPSTSSVD